MADGLIEWHLTVLKLFYYSIALQPHCDASPSGDIRAAKRDRRPIIDSQHMDWLMKSDDGSFQEPRS